MNVDDDPNRFGFSFLKSPVWLFFFYAVMIWPMFMAVITAIGCVAGFAIVIATLSNAIQIGRFDFFFAMLSWFTLACVALWTGVSGLSSLTELQQRGVHPDRFKANLKGLLAGLFASILWLALDMAVFDISRSPLEGLFAWSISGGGVTVVGLVHLINLIRVRKRSVQATETQPQE